MLLWSLAKPLWPGNWAGKYNEIRLSSEIYGSSFFQLGQKYHKCSLFESASLPLLSDKAGEGRTGGVSFQVSGRLLVWGKFSLCSRPICSWGHLHVDRTPWGWDSPCPWWWRQHLGGGCRSWGHCPSSAVCPHYSQSWFTSSLWKPDFPSSLQGLSSLLCPLCFQLG